MADILPRFLDAAEVAALIAQAARGDGWTPGRQHSGYDILPLRATMPRTQPLVARALAHVGEPFEDCWDVYFIRYHDGAHIPPHTDPAQHGRRHRRLNAVLAQAPAGGELYVDGARVDLAVGDAVLFRPDVERHEVTPTTGQRLLFSVGAWV